MVGRNRFGEPVELARSLSPVLGEVGLSSWCPRLALLQVILGVSGTVMSVLSIGALEKFEVSSQADHITKIGRAHV